MKYLRIWKQLTICSFATFASNRIDSLSYFLGKLIRFGFFWLMIASLFRFTESVAGYGKYEVLLFFLTYNLIDLLSQFFLRGIYLFQGEVRNGQFDFTLAKPINPLFYSMSRLTDLLDFIFLLPIIGLLIFVMTKLSVSPTLASLAIYMFFLCLGLLIVTAIHIISAAITLLTTESDNIIWLYRETIGIGRFPPEILSQKLQWIFTFVIPIIVIVGFPAKALLGVLHPSWMLTSCIITIFFFGCSLLLWKSSLKKYSSASS
ncbi:MAG: ABC-2 family transporter protein [Patescibacteria group bacterium]